MQTIEQSIEVDAAVSTVYNQWTQFESFPEFMEGVEEVRQLDDKRLHWVASIAGQRHEWDAEIVEQVPDQRISWRSITGKPNEGTVLFHAIDQQRTRVTVRLGYQPDGMLERMGNAIGVASARVKNDMERFKQFIESRGHETGAWRGEISRGESRPDQQTARSKRLNEVLEKQFSQATPPTTPSSAPGKM